MKCPNCGKELNVTYNPTELIAVCELLSWETNQSIARMLGLPLDLVRQLRTDHKRHNHHDKDDEDLNNLEW